MAKDFLNSQLGYSLQGQVSHFTLFSSHATKISLGLFKEGHLVKEIPLNRTGDIWHIGIPDLPPGLTYAYRCDSSDKWLIDPYAKVIKKQKAFATLPAPFDWQNDKPPGIARQDLIIYEMHVRGFTKHPSSDVAHPGTYLGLIEKIPYLKKLGINAVELMPIFGFDPTSAKYLVNYWGYNPLHFFAPIDWYADQDPISEFKTLVRELHKAGMEVILDVVYNHTGEKEDPINFRGLDNAVYYMLDNQGHYLNFTGCGNTFNTNHPVVQKLILDSLRYWIEEMHVDGFRFDLASIFTRDTQGHPTNQPPILDAMRHDPVISKVKLIAEAWDAAGLYQLGYFPKWGNWSEWNGRYRDIVRRFIKGTPGKAGLFANVLCGSEMIYRATQNPLASINFITAHDGFTLHDLVSYNQKHNLPNGENNRDGNNSNDSWNCGVEGPTPDPTISQFRERQMRNFLLALFLSQGVPMFLMGDEYGHTRQGNNNPYVQDNELNWFLWDKQNPKMFAFISSLIAFRKANPQFRHTHFLQNEEIEWFTDWNSRLVCFCLKPFYIAFNAEDHPVTLSLPEGNWRLIVNTKEDWVFHKGDPIISPIELLPYSALLLQKN